MKKFRYPLWERVMSVLIDIPTMGFYSGVKRATHIDMVEQFCKHHRRCSYKDFKYAFNRIQWEYRKDQKDSLFGEWDGMDFYSEMHASIIKFDSVGYVMSTYGLFLANRLKRKKIEDLKYASEHPDEAQADANVNAVKSILNSKAA